MALDYGKMEFAVSFKPITAFPLDSRSYYESLAAAEAAAASAVEAGSDQGTVYFGQTFVVVENGVAQMLQVQPDGTLSEIGGKIEIDENQFVIDEETGKLNLFGFVDAVAGAQPVVEEVEVEGEKVKRIKWVKPDTTTVDGLATAVADLETAQAALEERVTANETAIGDADSGLVKALNDVAADVALKANAADVYTKTEADKAHEDLTTEIGKKANASDVYTKNEVYTKAETDTAIAKAVTEADHLKRIILPAPSGEETVEDVISAWLTANDLAAAADQYIYMIPTGLQQDDNKYYEYIILVEGENLVVEQVGNWEVDLSDYVTEKDFEDYLKSYYTSEQVNKILEAYATTAAVSEAIGESLKNYYTIEQIGAFLDKIYTAEEVDTLVNTTIADYYKKSEIDAKLAPLATKQELTDGLAGKVDNDDLDAYYTKTEADEKFVAQEEGKSLVSDTEIAKLATVKENAEENYIKSVNDTQFIVSSAGKLDLSTAVTNALLTDSDKEKLNALVIGENNKVEISGTVNASNVQDLDKWVKEHRDSAEGLFSSVNAIKLSEIEEGAEKNYISSIEESQFSVVNGKLSFSEVFANSISELTEASGLHATKIANLENVLNGYVDEEGNTINGLIVDVHNIQEALKWQDMVE